MRRQRINLMGILLFIFVIININFYPARARALGAGLGLKNVDAATAFCGDESGVLRGRASTAEELSDASLGLREFY